MRITAVIPTKNRPQDIEGAVTSVINQVKRPSQLIVVDQSDRDTSRTNVLRLCANVNGMVLDYVHDKTITGLVPAKAASLALATGELICFLEDDVVLEKDYFVELEAGFKARPDMLGSCGVISEVSGLPIGYVAFFKIFHRGIYRDPRVGVHGFTTGKGHALISSQTLSGGTSAWRRTVFDVVRFDTLNDFFMLEDIEFSTRVAARLGEHLYINPNARLEHLASPVNRSSLTQRQRRKLREVIVFYKKRKSWPWALSSLLWLLVGLFLESVTKVVKYRSPRMISNFFLGISDGVRWRLRSE
jgi:glycosyltransferase involved in cell wall biosynthesis